MPSDTPRGLPALDALFARARAEHRAAFLPYYPIGYPDYDASLDAITAMAEAGADGFEIGVPFSDPLADGPTIQAATQIALENGTTVQRCLDAVAALRASGLTQPMLLMSYLNPLLAYGVDRFVAAARDAGADGLIIPDLPAEESALFAEPCARAGLALVFFLAPTSSPARIRLAGVHATGFIYVVSVTGITGERKALPADLTAFIARVRAETDHPLVLGFGISTPDHVREVSALTDGFIVGSALVKAGREGPAAVGALARTLRQATG